MQTGFQTIADQNKTVYYASNGQMQYGQQQIDGNWYLFDKTIGAMQTGFQTIADQNKTVYYASNGQMQYNQQQIDGNWYLFDKRTGAMQTGFQYIDTQRKMVYYDQNGVMAHGTQYINGSKYNFDLNNGTLSVSVGQNEIDGNWYFFDATGQMKTGFMYLTGQETNDGDKTVYYASNGQMQYGQQQIAGYGYMFNQQNGAMQYGQQQINGNWYLYNTSSGIMQTGFQYIGSQNKTVYYDGTGKMLYSWQNIDNNQYYFDNKIGAMATGDININGVTYTFDSKGQFESLTTFRNSLANSINEQLGNTLNVDWKNSENNYVAFALHDVAQLVAQNNLDATSTAVEKNLLENDNLNGTVAVYMNYLTGNDLQTAVSNGVMDFMQWYNKQKQNNWIALGVGGLIKLDSKSNNWVSAIVLYSNSKDNTINNETATSNTNYEVSTTYKNAGVTDDVVNGLKKDDIVSKNDLSLDTTIPEKLLQGEANNQISDANLKTIYETLEGSSKAIEGTKTYYDAQGNAYHYEFWLTGQTSDDKENNFIINNTGKKYGDNIVIQVTATLVWGKATESNATTGESTGKATSEMTTKEIEEAYESGTDTGLRYDGVTIKPISGMTDDTIRGVDISSYIALEDAGVQFYDFDGKAADLVKVLHDAGVNYLRLRLWNDPYNEDNETYGGGSSSEYNELQIAKEAAKYGMQVLLDFQYSDFWTDPGKQVIPKAWQNETSEEIAESVYLYTKRTLNDFANTGVTVGMVQVGNEITNGLLGIIASRDAGESYASIWDNSEKNSKISSYLNAGSKAVREVLPNAKVVIHIETPNVDKYSDIMTVLKDNNVDYDVLGSSYYPFWSENNNNGTGLGVGANTPSNLEAVEKMVKEKFGKEFVVLETGWTNSTQDADGTGNSISSTPTNVKYTDDPQGQVDELEDLYQALINQGGLGAFYWEPAWIPVKAGWENWSYNDAMADLYGTGWASKNAVGYAPDNVMYYNGNPAWGGTTWDNVTLFDDLGYPLQSLYVYKGMLNGYQTPSTATSKMNLKIDSVYNGGVILKDGSLASGDTVAIDDSIDTGVSDGLLTGKWKAKIDDTQLNKIAAQLNGISTAIVDKKTYFTEDGQAYHYEFWLSEGQSKEQKEWNFVNDNEGTIYGASLAVHVSATLVWGAATEQTV